MIIERATIEDIPQLLELIEICYRGDIASTGWTCETKIMGGNRTSEELLREEITTPGGCYLKYTDDRGKIMCCVYTKVIPKDQKIFVQCLCVYPSLQSQGFGKKMLAAAEDIAKESGCSKISIKVITVRKELIAWYEKIGFKFVGEIIPFPEGAGVGTPKIPLELGSWEKVLD